MGMQTLLRSILRRRVEVTTENGVVFVSVSTRSTPTFGITLGKRGVDAWMLLSEVTWEALEHAGIPPVPPVYSEPARDDGSVVVGLRSSIAKREPTSTRT